jgi:hypothetical protein
MEAAAHAELETIREAGERGVTAFLSRTATIAASRLEDRDDPLAESAPLVPESPAETFEPEFVVRFADDVPVEMRSAVPPEIRTARKPITTFYTDAAAWMRRGSDADPSEGWWPLIPMESYEGARADSVFQCPAAGSTQNCQRYTTTNNICMMISGRSQARPVVRGHGQSGSYEGGKWSTKFILGKFDRSIARGEAPEPIPTTEWLYWTVDSYLNLYCRQLKLYLMINIEPRMSGVLSTLLAARPFPFTRKIVPNRLTPLTVEVLRSVDQRADVFAAIPQVLPDNYNEVRDWVSRVEAAFPRSAGGADIDAKPVAERYRDRAALVCKQFTLLREEHSRVLEELSAARATASVADDLREECVALRVIRDEASKLRVRIKELGDVEDQAAATRVYATVAAETVRSRTDALSVANAETVRLRNELAGVREELAATTEIAMMRTPLEDQLRDARRVMMERTTLAKELRQMLDAARTEKRHSASVDQSRAAEISRVDKALAEERARCAALRESLRTADTRLEEQ